MDVGVEGPNCQNNTQDHPFERSTAFLYSRPELLSNFHINSCVTSLTHKKLAFEFSMYIFEYEGTCPPALPLASVAYATLILHKLKNSLLI